MTGPARLRYWVWWLPAFALIWAAAVAWRMPHPATALGEHWPLIGVGFLGAMIGNATAIGGGLVFIPVMMLIYQVPPVESLMLALATQAFGMTSGAVSWTKMGALPGRQALGWILPASLLGATFSTFVIHPNSLLVKGLFGPVSILIGVTVLYLLKQRGERDEIPAGAGPALTVIGFLGGLLTGWVAIGVGELLAAFLMLRYRLHPEKSIGLGVVALSVTSIYLALLHTLRGAIPWEMAAFLALGAVFGARFGPFLCQWVRVRTLKLAFAAVAIVDGALFVWQYWRTL